MRTATLTDLGGHAVGTITEGDDGTLSGQEKGASLIEQAPGKTFDDWESTLQHSTYLRFEVEGA